MTSHSKTHRWMPWQAQMAIDVAISPVVYFALHGHAGLSVTQVLLIAIAAGGLWTLIGLVVTRKLSVLTLCIIAGMAIGAILTGLTGSPKFGVAKDSIYTGAFSLVLLGSLAARRPLMFFLLRPFGTHDNEPAEVAQWNQGWSSPIFRRCMRTVTAAWALGLLAEAAARVVAVMVTSLDTAVIVGTVDTVVVLAALLTWTGPYCRRMSEQRRIAESLPAYRA